MSWTVRLSEAAENDFRDIVDWTLTHFGNHQAAVYAQTLTAAIKALHHGPDIPGASLRDEIAPGIRNLHVARGGRRGRHFVMFRVAVDEAQVIEVLRLLHDAMDLPRHLPSSR